MAYAVEVKVDPKAVKDEQKGHLPSQKIIMESKGHIWLKSNVEKNAEKNICTSLREREKKGIE